ncbi:hypothetical protein NUH88_11750 [Nisaea acidiphila]|uniref:Uncharacterized protein n=1 Tax=Nisaea acidiphila TaxID=1862145 RepID=A0A9J7AMA3_9PROT|nr:hypothetical protein [Nisaea acidiphila]UUX48090.1 hypothetical protein NUH88_11750 [Nisaea acidiphila]
MGVEITDRIEAEGEDGTLYVVLELTTMIGGRSLDQRGGALKGSYRYVLEDGELVNRLDDGRFQVFQTDEVLTPI